MGSAPPPASGWTVAGRLGLLGLLASWSWPLLVGSMGTVLETFLHGVDLIFHEAGHLLFMPLGRFGSALGGSLMQLLAPLIAGLALARRGDQFGVGVTGWWAGQNLVDLAPYIADARALQLVLLGGRTGREVEGHDWEYLLGALGWLEYDQVLRQAAHRLGLAAMAIALGWATWCLRVSPPHDGVR